MGDTAVSLHTLGGGGVILGNSKLKVSSPDQFSFLGKGAFFAKNRLLLEK